MRGTVCQKVHSAESPARSTTRSTVNGRRSRTAQLLPTGVHAPILSLAGRTRVRPGAESDPANAQTSAGCGSQPSGIRTYGWDMTEQGTYVEPTYERDTRYITTRITADGREGYPVEPGRYRLVVARACPWANRAIIVRRLLGLEDVLSMGICGPVHDSRSWTFDLDPGGIDPVLGIPRIQDAYFKRDPSYPRGITVPAIVDIPSAVVTNDFAQITLDLSTEWRAYHRDGAPTSTPSGCVTRSTTWPRRTTPRSTTGSTARLRRDVQQAYDEAHDRSWRRLDWLEEHLATRRYLVGEHITEADVRLFTTLVRFDPVYHGHFKCNRVKLIELPNLWGYARDLFQTPGFGDTIDFTHIKAHYYVVHRDINPTGVIPGGPDLSVWASEHDRASLGGSPSATGRPRVRHAMWFRLSTTPRWRSSDEMPYAAGSPCAARTRMGGADGISWLFDG